MRKLSKLFLALAAFLILSGGLLAVSGWAMGGERSMTINRGGHTVVLSPFGIHSIYTGAAEYAGGPGTLSELSLGAFTSLDITVDLSDVTVVTGADYGVDLRWKRLPLDYELDGGVLRVWSAEGMNLGPGDHGASVTVYLPAGARLEDVYVRSDLGDLDLSGFTTRSLTANASLGSVTLNAVEAGNADLTLDLGDLTARDFTVGDRLTLDSSMGSSTLSGTFHHMDLRASMGDLAVTTSLPRSAYTWDLAADMGDLSLDGERQSGWDSSLTGGQGENTVSARCDMGSVDLRFGA